MAKLKTLSPFPVIFPEVWASDWGEDTKGIWMAFTYKGARQAFRWIAPGRFMMGSPESEAERDDDEAQYEVILTKKDIGWRRLLAHKPYGKR